MKNYILILSCCLLFSSCTTPASSTPSPIEQAVNFPTVSPDTLPICTPADLGISSNSTFNSNNLVIGVTFTNKTKNACALSNPPILKINDDTGKTLAIEVKKDNSIKSSGQPALIGLTPADNIILTMSWQNYCQQTKMQSIYIQIELEKNKFHEVAVKIDNPPVCVSMKDPSTLNISSYSYPP